MTHHTTPHHSLSCKHIRASLPWWSQRICLMSNAHSNIWSDILLRLSVVYKKTTQFIAIIKNYWTFYSKQIISNSSMKKPVFLRTFYDLMTLEKLTWVWARKLTPRTTWSPTRPSSSLIPASSRLLPVWIISCLRPGRSPVPVSPVLFRLLGGFEGLGRVLPSSSTSTSTSALPS